MTQLIDGGAGDVMIFDERIGGFSRAAPGGDGAAFRLPENSV